MKVLLGVVPKNEVKMVALAGQDHETVRYGEQDRQSYIPLLDGIFNFGRSVTQINLSKQNKFQNFG